MKKITISKTTHPTGATSYSYPVDMSTVRRVQYASDMSYAIGESDDPTLPNATQSEIDAVVAANAPVPESVSNAQARAALIVEGLIDLVPPAIAAIEDPVERALVQNDFDNRDTFERHNGRLLTLVTALGLNAEQTDNLFRRAAQL